MHIRKCLSCIRIYSADQLEKAVAEIIHGYENEEPTFVSMKCGFPDTVHNILNGNKDITVDGVYTLKEEIEYWKACICYIGRRHRKIRG